jgi:hypothetical protein
MRKKVASPAVPFKWVDEYPTLFTWREYAVRWLADSNANKAAKVRNLKIFFSEMLLRLDLHLTPASYLAADKVWPNFYQLIEHLALPEKRRLECNDIVSDFLRWILQNEFSESDEYGDKTVLPGFANPIRRIQKVADRNIENIQLRAHNDKKLRWMGQLYPELAEWRRLAVEWMEGQSGTTKPRLLALQCFFRELIVEHNLPTQPRAFFEATTEVPDFYTQTRTRRSKHFASPWTTHLHNFTEWVLTSKFSEVDADGKRVIADGLRNPVKSVVKKGAARTSDVKLKWVTELRAELEQWRQYAAAWLASEPKGVDIRLKALVTFFDRYLVGNNLPSEPGFLLRRSSIVPDFYVTCCVTAKNGAEMSQSTSANTNNRLSDFLDWVLKHHFSIEDDDGCLMVSPAFRNPIPYRSHSGGWVNRESVHSPLPFGFIEDMRLMLCQGPTFSDWTWAQQALGAEVGVEQGNGGTDWFSVNEADIDKSDPDCVWRVRQYEAGHRELQMWSPVRWVGLLMKLQIPLRMLQVRLLDSGEADTWRYANGGWSENKSPMAEGTERKPLAQGLFRRPDHLNGVTSPVILYVNTNKTADQKKSGPAKGYEVPWPSTGPIHQNPFYWAERLRNWQEKYNPITKRTSWSELETRHIPLKSPEQLATYPNACFLFRMREVQKPERHLPMPVGAMNPPWFKLLQSLQERLAKTNQFDSGGLPFMFVPPPEQSNGGATTYFPMQSLRVSLITALALDGLVPFPILQKLVGHSRLLMTLYYTKMGPAYMVSQLEAGLSRLDMQKDGTIKRFAAEASYEELMKKAVYNSAASLKNAIEEDTGARNPAGWMLLHHGMCVVGGNTSELEENKKIGGCHNGGPNIGTDLKPKYSPVPGGSRNCVQCRWFMTQTQYLPSLVATFNNNAYHFDEARNRCLVAEEQLQAIRKIKYEAEMAEEPFQQMPEFLELGRLHELALKRFSDLAEKLVATWRLIERCQAVLMDDQSPSNQLIAVGTIADVTVAFEETESELLQLAGVCEGVEVYPDLEAGKAVFRRSQLFDSALCREGSSPVFMTMSEDEQLACGNAFMRQLAEQASPGNAQLGMRRVVELMDAGEQIGQLLGVDLNKLIPAANRSAKVIPIRPVQAMGQKL